jgi:VacB/RNase II family 3'-5' exoribonuclease
VIKNSIAPTNRESVPGRDHSQHACQRKSTDRATLVAIARQAMIDRGMEPDFTPAAQQELATITGPASAPRDLRDLRERPWSSIDNDNSRDLDQLTVAEVLTNEQVRILVAIADVDALIHQGSALDGHASRNTTSIYTPAVIFPMLPEVLSTDLTSLKEGQDRIALVIDMVFDGKGMLVTSNFYRACVHNRAKLAYNGVAAWLAGTSSPPRQILKIPGLQANLRLQDLVAQRLADLRHSRGALSLETIEATAIFEGDTLSDLGLDEKNRAKRLIEEFMIAANIVTATYLTSKNFPSLRRILRVPKRWDRIVQLAAQLREELPIVPDAVALEAFLIRCRTTAPDKFSDLSLSIVKLLGRGEYVLDLPGGTPPGHFGLALKNYTHSTAPNRRYSDLITQRLLKAAMGVSPSPYTTLELTEYARHCTEREDAATKVERRVLKSAAALLLSGRIGESFAAIVTGASVTGTWVRLCRLPTEGRMTLGFQGLDVGDPVRVKLIHTDVVRGFIDFARD